MYNVVLYIDRSAINSVSVHPSGKLALTVGADKSLHTWNLITGRSAFITNIKQGKYEDACTVKEKLCKNGHSQNDRILVFKTKYHLMHSAILLTFIKLPFVIKIFVCPIFEWLFYTGFIVFMCIKSAHPEVSEYD